METCVFILILSICGLCNCINTWDLPRDNLLNHVTPELDQDWLNYQKVFNKTYNSVRQQLTRRLIWEDNVRYIRAHNAKFLAGESTFEMGENHLADMAEDEIRKTYLSGLNVPEKEDRGELYPNQSLKDSFTLPAEKDWRREGYVTPVENQKKSGSCWAFAAVGALEGLHRKKTGTLVALSAQNLLDCAKVSNGCEGGWIYKAFDYVKRNGGIERKSCYPYESLLGNSVGTRRLHLPI